METSVKNSDLIQYRKSHVVPERMARIEKAIQNRDFQTFGIETMKDSNQFHAVCLDTYPPIFYMNDVSKKVINLITKYNDYYKQIRAAYTFDAGPNAVIYCPPQFFEEVKQLVNYYFPIGEKNQKSNLPSALTKFMEPSEDALVRIISTKVGPGPMVLPKEQSLLENTGFPKRQKTSKL